jgi:hypothetical protein
LPLSAPVVVKEVAAARCVTDKLSIVAKASTTLETIAGYVFIRFAVG